MKTRQVMTRYGKMTVIAEDMVISKSLIEYGEWEYGEISVLEQIIKPGMRVIDVGANIGCHTLAFSKLVGPAGWVLSLEPQPFVFSLLAANVIENQAFNVLALNAAASDAPRWIDMPNFSYAEPQNYGALRLHDFWADEGKETKHIPVPAHRLDDLSAAASAHLIKIDVEGMESAVLEGARGIISKSRPVLFVENETAGAESETVLRMLFEMGYDAYWQSAPIFNPNNFNGNQKDLFPKMGCMNVLAVPRESAIKEAGRKIMSASEHPRKQA